VLELLVLAVFIGVFCGALALAGAITNKFHNFKNQKGD
jgi:hypothetical protein